MNIDFLGHEIIKEFWLHITIEDIEIKLVKEFFLSNR